MNVINQSISLRINNFHFNIQFVHQMSHKILQNLILNLLDCCVFYKL